MPPRCVIPLRFERYRIEVSRVRYTSSAYERWRREHPAPKPHYEAVVLRGGFFATGLRLWCSGIECAGPGFDDVFGTTPEEAVSKARQVAREWVRWQRALGGAA